MSTVVMMMMMMMIPRKLINLYKSTTFVSNQMNTLATASGL